VSAFAKVLARVRAAAGRGESSVVVFDIDDTLCSTKTRHLRILREFAAQKTLSEVHQGLAETLSDLKPHDLRYSITDTARAANVTDPELLDGLKAFWQDRFFKNEYLSADAPIPGAPEFVRAVVDAGGTAVYLTGRDETMREGTLGALQAAGFLLPDGGKVRLVLKPRYGMDDLAFKQESLQAIAKLGAVIAAFENEPSYINAMRERFPAMTAVLLKTQHSGKPVEPHPEVIEAFDFTA